MYFKEKFLYHIWDAQHLNNDLITISQDRVKILYPGRWNTDSGPDFKGAIIQLGKEVLRGDVEIHIKTYDWKNHHHQEDPMYNEVILHVVYEHNGKNKFTINEAGKVIKILEMKDQLTEDIGKLLTIYPEDNFSLQDKFCDSFGSMNFETFDLILRKLGNRRLLSKKNRFGAELNLTDFNQLLYQGIMEAAGYSKNKFQLLNLAIEINYSNLKSYFYQGMNKEELVAILLNASCLVDHPPKIISHIWIENMKILYEKQEFISKKINIKWNLFRLRPANHPMIRIIQLSDFIYNSLQSTFFYSLLKIFSFTESNFSMQTFNNQLNNLFRSDHVELPDHYRLGKERIKAFLINILLPLVLLYSEKMNYPKLGEMCYTIYAKIPGQSHNNIFNQMLQFMDNSQRKLIKKSAIHQQGLLKLYFDYCQHHRCSNCKEMMDSMVRKI